MNAGWKLAAGAIGAASRQADDDEHSPTAGAAGSTLRGLWRWPAHTWVDAFSKCGLAMAPSQNGTFTELLVAAGADVVRTGISLQSADRLNTRFAVRHNIEVRHADVAKAVNGERFDTIVLISVLELEEEERMAVVATLPLP